MLEVNDEIVEDTQVLIPPAIQKQVVHNSIWKLVFNGAYSKEENGAGVLLLSPRGEMVPLSYILEFHK